MNSSMANRWWLWASAAAICSWAWTLPFVPLEVAIGTGFGTAISVVLMVGYVMKRRGTEPTLASYLPSKDDIASEPDEIEALVAKPDEMVPIPPVDQLLKTMEAENHRRRLEDLLRR